MRMLGLVLVGVLVVGVAPVAAHDGQCTAQVHEGRLTLHADCDAGPGGCRVHAAYDGVQVRVMCNAPPQALCFERLYPLDPAFEQCIVVTYGGP